MPKAESYIAEVTVSVKLKSTADGVVAEYEVTRKATGTSYTSGEETRENLSGAVTVVESALTDAVAAQKAVLAGVQNAERRRLK